MINLLEQRGGLDMLKTLFLYLKTSNDACSGSKYIYSFSNRKIVGVDVERYNTKSSRYSLQHECKINPYKLSNEIFSNLFNYGINNANHIRITNIEMQDFESDDIEELHILLENLLYNRYDNIIANLNYIIDVYDAKLMSITFKYKGYDIKLGSEGVVRIDAPNEVFSDFLYDKEINSLILGARL
ncbi:hypothetical protein [Vallitalea guaymasensis]|uniref:Uncharacterized protein n=1 Tax=Vallitalea guaymasensis TaxID=1185412 RepID=A0A8J8MB08_9FIRM|nr:hypothetical protein [Vallitalea guaymasensis]QUH29607.1 hypothetical protein HYG85_12105 [Vallitalea guaymasensis]